MTTSRNVRCAPVARVPLRTVMVKTVDDHYAHHLGPVYTWMVGDLDAAFSRSAAELDALPLPSKAAGTAVDLGAGFDFDLVVDLAL